MTFLLGLGLVLLTAGAIHGGDPALPGVIDTGIRHEQGLRLLDAHSIIIQQYLYGLAPASLIDVEDDFRRISTNSAGML